MKAKRTLRRFRVVIENTKGTIIRFKGQRVAYLTALDQCKTLNKGLKKCFHCLIQEV